MWDIFADLAHIIYTAIKCIKPSTRFSVFNLQVIG